MPLSYAQNTGDGVTRVYDVPCEYLSRSHITVRVDGTDVPFTWLDTYRVQTNTAPASGTVVEVRRTTPREERLVTFTDGSTLVETDLNTSSLQSFFLSQEAFDQGEASMGVTEDGQFSALQRRVTNAADPINDQDLVTRRWAMNTVNTNVGLSVSARDAAIAARDVATAARDTTVTARNTTTTARDTTLTYRNEAEGFAQEAGESASDADNQRALAMTARTGAEAARDAAATTALGLEALRDQAEDAAIDAEAARDEAIEARDDAEALIPVRVDGSTGQVAFRNKLLNGAMRVSQRGASGAGSGYCLDRWSLRAVSGTNAHAWSRQDMGMGDYPMREGLATFLRWSKSGTGTAALSQRIEDVRYIPGDTQFTVSFWAKASTATTIQLVVLQNFGLGGTPTQTGNGPNFSITTGWQKFQFTFTVPSLVGETVGINSFFDFQLRLTGVSTLDITGIQFEQGASMTPFEITPYSYELMQCRRYYYQEDLSSSSGLDCVMNTDRNSVGYFHFPVPMRVTPTLSSTYSSFDSPFASAPSQGTVFSTDASPYGFRVLFDHPAVEPAGSGRGLHIIVKSGVIRASAEMG